MKSNLSKARRLFLDPPYKPGSTAFLHAQPFDTWRLDFALEDGEDAEVELQPQRIEARLDAHLAMMGLSEPRKIIWTSVYRPRSVTLPSYRRGRVFFAGDAAHQTPIFGGRGLNLGFADVINLTWKLAYVLNGQGHDALLDSYDRERRHVVRNALIDLAQSTIFMSRPTRGAALMRDAALQLSPTESFVHDLFDGHRAPKREGISLGGTDDKDPPKGAFTGNPLPDAALQPATGGSGSSVFLYDLLSQDFTGLYFSAQGKVPDSIQRFFAQMKDKAPFRSIVVGQQNETGAHADALDPDGAASKKLEAADGAFILVRPDSYVAGQWDELNSDQIATTLFSNLGRGAP
jgi:3-(3-hydroxy-phenyl)propionate hydroxylase